MRRKTYIGAVLIGLSLVAITHLARPTLAQSNLFTDLSATLSFSTATFSFAYSGNATYFYIDLSTVADMSWDVYGNFAEGSTSPVIQTGPTGWDKYTCSRTLYWRVRTASDPPSPIQTATVTCTTPTPTFTPSPTPTPIVCSGNTVWNGNVCKPLELRGDTTIVGLDAPVASRSELDEIEKNLSMQSLPGLTASLIRPSTIQKAQNIQDIRLTNWPTINTDRVRTIELLLNASAKGAMDQNQSTIGADAITTLMKHADAHNAIWSTAVPSINRKAIISRIIIVADAVASRAGGGWQVVNNTGYSFWANDILNGIAGDIPYDIDSRWVLLDDFAQFLIGNGTRFQGVLIDYGMLHEITHHLPVGDNYVYNMGSGHGFLLPQENGKSIYFPYNYVSFMDNDHMSGPSAPKLTASSSYHINLFWKLNPKSVRSAQAGAYPTQHVYGNYFFQSLSVALTNLRQAGVTGCAYYRQQSNAGIPASQPLPLFLSTDHTGISFNGDTCQLTLNRANQLLAFPGGYIGLVKNGATFPIFLPRNLLETLAWVDYPTIDTAKTFTITTTDKLAYALDYLAFRLRTGINQINMAPSRISALMDTTTEGHPDIIGTGPIDGLGNQYILSFQAPTIPRCSAGDIDQNGNVDMNDLTILKRDYLSPLATNPRSDITKDGIVDLTDYSWFVLNFGKTTAGPCL